MRAILFGLLIAIAGCAPAATPAPAAPIAAATPAPQAATRPPQELLVQDGVNYACNTPADCAVKNVGSCCGAMPACVNKDSPTFPEKVKAECSAQGMSSICGFQDITACDCIEGRCAAQPATGAVSGDVQKD